MLVPQACKVVEVNPPSLPPPSPLVRADFQYKLLAGTDTISPKIVAWVVAELLLHHPHCEKKLLVPQ
jgi:hypothetical protein